MGSVVIGSVDRKPRRSATTPGRTAHRHRLRHSGCEEVFGASHSPPGKCPWRKHWKETESASAMHGSQGKWRRKGTGDLAQPRSKAAGENETHINKQVLPQAPSPTMTNFLRSSAAMVAGC